VVFENGARGRTRGIEAWASWQASKSWRLSGGAVTQHVETALNPDSKDISGATGLATSDPSHYWMLRSSYDINDRQELDVTLRRVGALSMPTVPAYTGVDVRYGWRIHRGLELSVIGQNLLGGNHAEYGAPAGRSVSDRALYVKLVWNQ
jgi:iron complex outermembrane receptor protein